MTRSTVAAPAQDGASHVGVPSSCVVAALDVGGTKIAGGLVVYGDDPAQGPRVLARRSVPTEAARGGDAVLATLVEQARALVAAAGELPETAGLPVAGVGVSAAGSIRESDGLVAFANSIMPGWMGQPVGQTLARELGLPAAVLNDVRAHALGEVRHGAARGARSCIMVAAGTGLGGAVVVEGHVLQGARGFAGMLGHTLHPAALGVPSAWGTTGHLESVASGSGIETCYRLAGGDAVGGAEISRRALAGEELARSVIEQAGRSLGEAIASWADVVDPELVVVAGSVCNAGELWRAALDEGLAARLAPELAGLRVVEAALGGDAPLVGAAEQLRDRLAG